MALATKKRRRPAKQGQPSRASGWNRVEVPAAMLGRPGERYEKACYRYRTQALIGPWRRRPEQALDDAVKAKQARREGKDDFRWIVDGAIEESFCDRGGPCGGVYPEE